MKKGEGKLVAVLVRGEAKTAQRIKDTLAMLQLHRKNHCVVLESTPPNLGMLDTVKDFITWGEIDNSAFEELVKARGEERKEHLQDRRKKYSFKTLDVGGIKYKPYFRLNPPRKGFGRKGIKVAFVAGGAIGYRGIKINDLLRRMI